MPNSMSNPNQGALRVLTVHFNTPELTSRLVRDFPRRQTPDGRAVSMHILDNCSTPQNLRALRASIEGLSGVTLEVNDENIGFGEGLNLLAESDVIDESDILWFLNPDTRLEPGCLELLEDELLSADYAVVSPLVYSGEGADSWIWYCGGSISDRDLRPRLHLYGCRLAEAPDRSFETEFITGAAPMMRASTFRAVGGFPRGYFLYWEDAYLSRKVRDLGLRLGVVPLAHLWHAVGASSGFGQSRTFYYWYARNRFTFARDTGVPRRRLLTGPGGLETLRIVATAMLEREGRLSKTSAAVRGTFAGRRRARTPR
jgi:N-acetylglucosaminyl-diphospho-decaprenol L-rhamnosyltransferase